MSATSLGKSVGRRSGCRSCDGSALAQGGDLVRGRSPPRPAPRRCRSTPDGRAATGSVTGDGAGQQRRRAGGTVRGSRRWRRRSVLGRRRGRRRPARAPCRPALTHVSAGPSSADPLVAGLAREGGSEVGPDLVLHVVVELVVRPALAVEQPAQVGVEVRLDGTHRHPPVVGAAVGVVAGVPTGEDVVARPGRRRRWPGTRRCTSAISDSTPSAIDTSR